MPSRGSAIWRDPVRSREVETILGGSRLFNSGVGDARIQLLRSVKLILGGRIRRDAEAGGFSLVDIEEILRRGLILWLEGLNARGE